MLFIHRLLQRGGVWSVLFIHGLLQRGGVWSVLFIHGLHQPGEVWCLLIYTSSFIFVNITGGKDVLNECLPTSQHINELFSVFKPM